MKRKNNILPLSFSFLIFWLQLSHKRMENHLKHQRLGQKQARCWYGNLGIHSEDEDEQKMYIREKKRINVLNIKDF